MTTTVTNITAQEKQQLVGRFVADVLAKRSIKLVKARHAFITKLAKKKFNKKVIDMVDKIFDMCKDDEYALQSMGIEVNMWLRREGVKTKNLTYRPDLDLLNSLESNDIPGMPTELTIELPHEVLIDEDDWYWELSPNSGGSSPDEEAWSEFDAIERKLKEDAQTLSKIASKSIARKRTWEAVEKNCPELAPYIDTPDENTPCPAELADMASCMRVKDDC